MKKLAVVLSLYVLGSISLSAQSQSCNCKAYLDFLVEKIKKMPSYKKQIKGEKAEVFLEIYTQLSSKMTQPLLIEDCYKLLLEQMLLVNDAHASLDLNIEFLTTSILEDDNALSKYMMSDSVKNHPKTKRDISELKDQLAKKEITDLEGLYINRDKETIGIYYAENKKDLIGVLLETDLKHWTIGDIRFYATHTNTIKYDVYYYNTKTRTPGLVKSLSFENGRIWHYKKIGNTNGFEFVDHDKAITVFKQLNENTQYLYFKTFGNYKKKDLVKFYNETKDKLNAKNIIVDLRSNTGGNSKYSDVYLKLLKNKNVYILTNCFTGSNGEQFTLKLLKNKNAKHLGQTTFGVISYGLNYGRSYATPSDYFTITPTDMNFHKYIDYEGKGVVPEIPLAFDRDWIDQTLEMIDTTN